MIAERVSVCADPECGAAFTPRRRDAQFCSVACKQRAYRRRQRRSGIPEDLAELAWHEAGGDGLVALDAALAVVRRLEAA